MAGFFESYMYVLGKRKVPLSFCSLVLSFKLCLYNLADDPLGEHFPRHNNSKTTARGKNTGPQESCNAICPSFNVYIIVTYI